MKNLKLMSAALLLSGIAFVSACSDGDDDEGSNGGSGGQSTGGQSTGGDNNGTGSTNAGTGGKGTGGSGTGGSSTGGMGGMSEGGMGGLGMGGSDDEPVEDAMMCIGACAVDADCPLGLCDEGACTGCAEDFHCEYSKSSCTEDADCDGIFTDTCIKDGSGGGICALADSGFCFVGSSSSEKKFADDSDIDVCKIAEVCDAGRCASACSDAADCTGFDAAGGPSCNSTTGLCDVCDSGDCTACSAHVDCEGKGGSCVEGMCACTDTADCTDSPTYGGTATCQ